MRTVEELNARALEVEQPKCYMTQSQMAQGLRKRTGLNWVGWQGRMKGSGYRAAAALPQNFSGRYWRLEGGRLVEHSR